LTRFDARLVPLVVDPVDDVLLPDVLLPDVLLPDVLLPDVLLADVVLAAVVDVVVASVELLVDDPFCNSLISA
jgi:hypothetical protein